MLDISNLAVLIMCLIIPVLGDFIDGRRPYYILEELQGNTLIGNVAIDEGLTQKYNKSIQSQLYYSFLKPADQDEEKFKLFDIDRKSSIIKTTQQIDRDKICPQQVTCYVKFDVVVGPQNYFEVIKIIIDILDVNDHSPEFDNSNVFLRVSESANPGTTYALPTATDPDSTTYSIQHYELVAHTPKFGLVKESSANGVMDLRLIIKEKLDREQADFYQFQLMAFDGGDPPRSGSILVNIEVEDSNDNNPKFDNATYEVFVLENIEPGTTIARVHAQDLDSGTNGQVKYTFSERTLDKYGHLFDIENDTGSISLKEALDFEDGSTYLLVVLANDHGPDSQPAHASVVVHVEDSNDNPPEISLNTLTSSGIGHVTESAAIGTFVAHVSVSDQDGGDNGKVECSLTHQKFTLQRISPNQYNVVTTGLLDKEKEQQYRLSITCTDLGFQPKSAHVQLSVRVLDDNDHPPKFDKKVYMAFIQENNYINQEIIKVKASDPDNGMNSDVTYKIQARENIVSINPRTGVITASAVFDREKMTEYTFQIVASDRGIPPLSSTATVVLSITDSNDEAPKFPRKSYAFGIFENQPKNSEVGTVLAVDKDTPQYAKFKYSFSNTSGNATSSFSIDPHTGKIYTQMVLDRELQPVYYLTVNASSDAFPPLSGTTSVTIYVADSNDNAPVITWPTYTNNTVFVSSLVPVGYELATIDAQDRDIGGNGKLMYSISAGNQDNYFNINPAIGIVTTIKDLRNIIYQTFSLTVMVEDDGYPKLSSSTILNIIVNQSIAYKPPQRILYTNNNTTIIISLTSASLVLIFLLVVAILLVRKQTMDRKHGSDRTEVQKMLHRDQPPEWSKPCNSLHQSTGCIQQDIHNIATQASQPQYTETTQKSSESRAVQTLPAGSILPFVNNTQV